MRLCGLQHDAPVILAQGWREILPNFVECIFEGLGRQLAAFLDQVERRPQPALKVLAASELLNAGRDREAMALDRRAGKLEFDILKIGIEDAHLARDVELNRWSLLQPLPHRRELLIDHLG